MKIIDLNGTWRMRQAGSTMWMDTLVPGSVVSTLMDHHLMDDPYYRDNEKKTLPIFENDYEFSRTFTVNPDQLKAEQILLHCDGLDTVADIILNDTVIASVDNMHRIYRFDVKNHLVVGENEIRILFHSPVKYLKDHPSMTGKPFATLRKAHSMFGWDWGIKLPDSGIWRDIYLEGFSTVRLDHVQIRQKHQEGSVWLKVTANIFGFKPETKVSFRLFSPSGEGIFSSIKKVTKSGKITERIFIPSPQLWWPVGYGKQPLYQVQTAICQDDDTVLDEQTKTIGLRTIVLNRAKAEQGSKFEFVVNGKPIYFEGENLIIQDAILSRFGEDKWSQLIQNCLRSNLNGIRVWGGAFYPPDCFYDFCDVYGLLVYQDFMFACTFYFPSKAFTANVKQETEDFLKRTGHHACIALLCGNNEADCNFTVMTSTDPETEALRRLFGQSKPFDFLTKTIVSFMYRKLFLQVIPSACRKLTPDTSYTHSTPSIRRPLKANSFFDYLSDGDMHYYLQYNGNAPYQKMREFRVRFMSEMGFQSYPSMKTIQAFTEEADRTPYSDVMYAHQKCANGNETIELYMERDYGVPKDFSDYVYLSQLQAGEILKYSIEQMRRDNGYNRGVIIWQLNDCWPVVSWSGIDYFGRWKGQQYYTKRFFSPILISAFDQGEKVQLFVTNDSLSEVKGVVEWTLRDQDSAIILSGGENVTIGSGVSKCCIDLDFHRILIEKKKEQTYLEYRLLINSTIISSGTHLFVLPKDFLFQTPKIEIAIRDMKEQYEISLTADRFTKGLALDLSNGDAIFSDNFFDLLAGETKTITAKKTDVTGVLDLDDFLGQLEYHCINNLFPNQ